MKHLAHPLIAIVIQAAMFVFFGNWWFGVAVATIAYLFRETTQAEYRWIEAYGFGLRKNMPWWGRFDPRVWSAKDWADWLGPLVVTSAVAAVMT